MARPKVADITEKELNKRIDQYFKDVEEGVIHRVGWSHFASYLDLSLEQVKTILNDSGDTYVGHARAIKKAFTKLRGIIETSDAYSGGNSSKGIFLLKQDVDGCAYQDKTDIRGSGEIKVKLEFGGSKNSFD